MHDGLGYCSHHGNDLRNKSYGSSYECSHGQGIHGLKRKTIKVLKKKGSVIRVCVIQGSVALRLCLELVHAWGGGIGWMIVAFRGRGGERKGTGYMAVWSAFLWQHRVSSYHFTSRWGSWFCTEYMGTFLSRNANANATQRNDLLFRLDLNLDWPGLA